jgi:acetyl-CoA carboxylase carboxyl transferase subunit beta
MSLKDLFIKKQQYATIRPSAIRNNTLQEKPTIPSGMWEKCDKCNAMIYAEDLENSKYVCSSCGHHFRVNAKQRVRMFFDKDTFKEFWRELKTTNPLEFKGYAEKLRSGKTDSTEAVVTGVGQLNGINIACEIMDSFLIMVIMGTLVG